MVLSLGILAAAVALAKMSLMTGENDGVGCSAGISWGSNGSCGSSSGGGGGGGKCAGDIEMVGEGAVKYPSLTHFLRKFKTISVEIWYMTLENKRMCAPVVADRGSTNLPVGMYLRVN